MAMKHFQENQPNEGGRKDGGGGGGGGRRGRGKRREDFQEWFRRRMKLRGSECGGKANYQRRGCVAWPSADVRARTARPWLPLRRSSPRGRRA